MSILEMLKDESAKWDRKPPAEESEIQRLIKQSCVELPEEYIALLRYSNGGEGELGIEPGWFQIWPAEQVIELNRELEVQNNTAGLFGFGSNGGGELLAFDIRTPKPCKVFMIPFIPMQEEEAVKIADDFISFVKAIGHPLEDA